MPSIGYSKMLFLNASLMNSLLVLQNFTITRKNCSMLLWPMLGVTKTFLQRERYPERLRVRAAL